MTVTARPVVGAPAPWSFPVPSRDVLPTGLTLYAHDLPGQLVCSVRLAVPMPLRAEPRGAVGVGTILARTLDEGTARRSSDEMSLALERCGAALRAGITDHGLVVDLDVPRRRLGVALELLRECIAEPAFAEPEVARHVRMRRSEIDHEHADPGSAAALAFLAAYYPADHRFSRPAAGDAAGIGAITPETVRAHHRAHVRPDRASLVLAGDLSDVAGLDLLADVMGEWTGPAGGDAGAAPEAEWGPAAVRAPAGPEIVVVDRPGSVQSEIYVGSPGPARDVAGGWAPYPVLAMIVGGAPQARLDAVLREDKGYTYGMRCGFRPRPGGGLFVTSGSVRADASVDGVRLVLDILDAAADGFTEAETKDAVEFVTQTAPGRYATADTVAAETGARCLDGTGPDETDRVLRATRRLTRDDLAAAYSEHIARTWTTVVVGDAEAIVPGLSDLGRGDVRVVGV